MRISDCSSDVCSSVLLVLGLAGELRVGHLHGQHAGQALARVVAGKLHLLFLQQAGGGGVVVDLTCEGGAKAGQVGAAIPLRDVVSEAEHRLVIARSEERRVGTECVSTCRSRWSAER